jgi:hypothetical protein
MSATTTGAAPQRVCPHCSTVAHTPAPHCPFCRGSYRRRTLGALAAMLAATAAVILVGIALLLAAVGDRLDAELDAVQRDVELQVDGLQEQIREDLDRRLPAAPGG